jgi:hypothetical protein
MIETSCHCGAVRLTVSSAPEEITECNCSICRRYGVLWAYYMPAEVKGPSPETTNVYTWDDRSIEFHRCRTCGCVSHWAPVDAARNRMGVNVRLMPLEALVSARLRHLDGAVTEEYLD